MICEWCDKIDMTLVFPIAYFEVDELEYFTREFNPNSCVWRLICRTFDSLMENVTKRNSTLPGVFVER